MRKGNTLIPALIVIGAMLVGVLVVALYVWPKDSDFAISVPVVHRAKTNVNSNVNISNTNTVSNTNSTTDPTAGWKTYTNTTYKYSLKYPTEYAIASTPNGDASILLEKGKQGTSGYRWLAVGVTSNHPDDTTESQDVYEWANNGFSFSDKIVQYHQNPKREKLGNTTFVVTDGDTASSGYPEYLVFHNDLLYGITTDAGKTQTTNREIISTFAFTE